MPDRNRRPSRAPQNGTGPTPWEPANDLLATAGTLAGDVQRQLGRAVDEVRVRAQEAAEQAQERAASATELAVKLAYASVGAVVVAQEEVTARIRAVRR